MKGTRITGLIVVSLCLGAMAVEQPAPVEYGSLVVLAAGEPTGASGSISALSADATNVWAPAQNIAATWESVTVLSKLYNPAEKPGAKVPERSLSLAARVDVVDVNGVLGFDSTPVGTLVLDGKPSVIYSKPVPSKYCHFYWPLRYFPAMATARQAPTTPPQVVSQLQPYNLTVDVPLDPNHPSYPTLLSRVEWSMYALVNTQTKTVDVPFSPGTDWVTLAPGLDIKVDQANVQSGKFDYKLSTRYSPSRVLWATSGLAIMIWTSDPTPEVILTKIDVLDPQKSSILGQSGAYSSGGGASGSGDLMTGTYTGSGSCSICGTATTFRFVLSLQPVQQEYRFILQNVPVPLP